MTRLQTSLAAFAATLGLGGTPAGAATLDGSPLNVIADGAGRLQVRLDNVKNGEFDPALSDAPAAGFNLGFTNVQGPPLLVGVLGAQYGGTSFVPAGAPVLAGDGTVASPRTLTSIYDAQLAGAALARVTEVLSYVDGRRAVVAQYVVRNMTAQPLNLRASVYGDTVVAGADDGLGLFQQSPRFVGAVKPADAAVPGLDAPNVVGAEADVAGLQEVTGSAWTSQQEGDAQLLADRVGQPAAPGFDGTVDANKVDTAVGAQWDDFLTNRTLAPDGTTAFTAVWRFTRVAGDAGEPGDSAGPPAVQDEPAVVPPPPAVVTQPLDGPDATPGKTERAPEGAVVTEVGGVEIINEAGRGGSIGIDSDTGRVDVGTAYNRLLEPVTVTAIARIQGPLRHAFSARAATRVLGTATVTLRPGETKVLRFKLSRDARRALFGRRAHSAARKPVVRVAMTYKVKRRRGGTVARTAALRLPVGKRRGNG